MGNVIDWPSHGELNPNEKMIFRKISIESNLMTEVHLGKVVMLRLLNVDTFTAW